MQCPVDYRYSMVANTHIMPHLSFGSAAFSPNGASSTAQGCRDSGYPGYSVK